MTTHLLYIHGFKSSPKSHKAQVMTDFIEQEFPEVHFYCPQLAYSPKHAAEQLEAIINSAPEDNWGVIGSSLGGYFAHHLVEKFGGKAVLVNPAIKPYELLTDYIGEQQAYHSDETFIVEPYFMDDLKAIEVGIKDKSNYLVMVQTEDEVLDYQQAVEKYQGCQLIVQEGGDHSFQDFDKMLPNIVEFFNL